MDTSHKLPEDLLLSNDIEPSSPSSSSSMDTSHQQPEDLLNPPTSHLPSNDIEPFFPSSSMGTSDKQSEDLLNPLTSLLPSNNIESSASSSSMGTSHNQPEDLLNPPTSLIPSHDIESFASSSSMSTSHNQPEDLLNPPTSLIPSHDIESFASSSMGTSHNQPEDLLNPPTSLLLSNDIESFASSFMGTSHNQPDLINLSTPLLSNDIESPSSNPSQQQIPTKTLLFTSILVIFCIALASIAFFVFIFFSSGAPPRIKFNRDIVILISSDGFRFDYKFKTETPNIDRLISGGTEAKMGLIPVFPTLTFPNHYSIVTGLYPAFHGMVNNFFYDPSLGEKFAKQSNDPKWWFGEPLWETVVKNGFNASTYFWPGSEVIKGSWTCPSEFCPPYDDEIPFEHRVDTVLGYFDHRPISEIPALMTLYFEDPDTQGHQYGPDAPQIVEAVARIDNMIGRLIQGLEKRGIFENVTIILVGDHGMAGTSDDRLIILEDLAKWIKIPKDWVEFYGPLLSIRPPNGVSPRDVVAKMNKGLRSGEVENGMHLKVYLKEDLPKRFHYSASDRIAPIIGLVDDGFKALTVKRPERSEFGGTHGYDNSLMSMRTIFVGHGPWFARGYKVKSFENVEIYNMVTTILNITGAPNNGSSSFAKNILLM